MQCPEYVAVSPVNGDIVVTDFERHAVVVFDKFGRWLARYTGAEDSGAPTARSGLTDRNRLRYKRILEVSIVWEHSRDARKPLLEVAPTGLPQTTQQTAN